MSTNAPVPELSSIAYLVYDGDFDYVILERNAWQKRSIASITKVMTLFYCLELVEQGELALDAVVTASSRAASRKGTQINIKAGDQFTLEELLYAAALVSANDAAVAIAEYVAGSEAAFVRLLNERAKELGLKDTHYVDCTGLLSIFSNNYSTAYDQVKLLQAAVEVPLFRQIMGAREYYLAAQGRKLKNSHPHLELAGVEGGKTGATTPAGHTLITSRHHLGRRLITIVLGARSRDVRNAESLALLDWAYNNLRVVIANDELITPVIVRDGVDHQINGILAHEFSVVALNDTDLEFERAVELLEGIKAPVERGDKLGELIISSGGEEFARIDIVAQQGTGLTSWLRRIFNRVYRYFLR
ncbi:MAG TPA: D-alanyl-D-alanine carboxypeptidase [Firmicutes bacterium]|nr:D-alanyl-D-alanine carboxypeptidase [Bacillota bacterium]